MTLEQTDIKNVARNIVLEKRKVRIIATTDLQLTPFYVTPTKSQDLRDYEYGSEATEDKTGAAWMKQVFSEGKAIFIDPDDKTNTESIPVNHLEVFDCSRKRDAAIFLVLALTNQLAENKAAVNPDHHMFYIDDKESEAQVFTSKLEKKRKCWDFIDAKIPIDDLPAYFKLIKLTNPSNMSRNVMLSSLQEEADKNPADVYKIITDTRLPYKLLVQKLIIEGTVVFNSIEST